LLREVAISAQFGTSADLGAYRAAFKVTDLLYMVIIGGALGSSFIPVFIQVWERDGEERAWRLASAIVTWALGILAVASGVIWVFAPTLTEWFYGGQGFDAATLALTTDLTRLFLLSPLLLGLGGLAMAVLNAHNHFALPALAPAIYNIGIIAGAMFLAPHIGIWGLAWGVIIGAALYIVLQLPGLWHLGMRVRITLGRRIAETRTVAMQMAPRVVGQAASQLSILVTAALTARLAMGAERIAGLDYAYQLMLLPYGVFSLSLSTVAFPQLARLFAEGQMEELMERVRRTLGIILFLTLPAMIALIALDVPLVRLLFQRGEFGVVSLQYTVIPLIGYALALPAFSASEILIRTFYAMQQTLIPVLVGLLQVSLNIMMGSAVLYFGGGVGALAFAFSIANTIEAILLFFLLGRQLPSLWRDDRLWKSVRAAVIATVALGGMLWGISLLSQDYLPFLSMGGDYRWPDDLLLLIGWLVAMGGVGAMFYIGMTAVLGAHEGKRVIEHVKHIGK
jgi:putative peptidoglycan lipid II flippase